MVEVVVVMVHMLLLVIILTNGVNVESNLAISDEVPHQLCSISSPR
jgi:hypothetical protein